MPINSKQSNHTTNSEGWWLLLLAAMVLLLLFFRLFTVLRPDLDKAATALREHRAIKLAPGMDAAVLKKIIAEGNYYTDQRDIDLLADSLQQKLFSSGPPDNLGALNKNTFSITAPLPWKTSMGGIDFQDRLTASRQRLGFDSTLYVQELTHPAAVPSTGWRPTGTMEMSGLVLQNEQPMPGVLVQLREHIAAEDSISGLTMYTRTNSKGAFLFTGLYADSGYSILPMQPGLEFGNRRGSPRLDKNLYYTFTAKPHTIRLLGTIVYGQLKDDGALLVRTPAEFSTRYQLIAGALILSFLLVQLLLSFTKKRTDIFLLPLLLLLSNAAQS